MQCWLLSCCDWKEVNSSRIDGFWFCVLTEDEFPFCCWSLDSPFVSLHSEPDVPQFQARYLKKSLSGENAVQSAMEAENTPHEKDSALVMSLRMSHDLAFQVPAVLTPKNRKSIVADSRCNEHHQPCTTPQTSFCIVACFAFHEHRERPKPFRPQVPS